MWISLGLLASACISAAQIPESGKVPIVREHLRLREGLLQTRVLALLAAGMLMSVAHAPLYTFYSIHLVANGYGKSAVGALWSLGVMAEILVFAFMPRLMPAGSLRNILALCFALAALRFTLVGWVIALPLVAILAQLLHGASFGAHHAASITALNRWFPPHQQGTVQSLFGSISYGAGGVIGSVLCGYSWDRYGAAVTYTGAAVFALSGSLLIWWGLQADEGSSAAA